MKIVVIGGTGLIGSKVVAKLNARGHEAVPASPNSGVNTLTGEGLDAALAGANVVVDLSNSPSFADEDVLDFFTTSGRNIAAAEKRAGVDHHFAVSIVGADKIADSGYMRAKVAQENVIREGGIPHTILRSTQFYEFLRGIANSAGEGDELNVTTALIQPVTAEDLSSHVTDLVLAAPLNGITEIAGPESFPMADLVAQYLQATGDKRKVVGDAHALYFGADLAERALVPAGAAFITATGFRAWLPTNLPQAA